MTTLDTYAALLTHQHGLDAFCPTCQRWLSLDLAQLVAEGRGGESFIGRKPRCAACGSAGQFQVRPPVPQITAL